MTHPTGEVREAGGTVAVLYVNLYGLDATERRTRIRDVYAVAEDQGLTVGRCHLDDCAAHVPLTARPRSGWRSLTKLVEAPQSPVDTVIYADAEDLGPPEHRQDLEAWAARHRCALVDCGLPPRIPEEDLEEPETVDLDKRAEPVTHSLDVQETFLSVKEALDLPDPCDPERFVELRDRLRADLSGLLGSQTLRDSQNDLVRSELRRARAVLQRDTPHIGETAAWDHLRELAWVTRCLACLHNCAPARQERDGHGRLNSPEGADTCP
ncbi:hypothetical protein [Streptomyces lasiicapitis]|uniref:Uncharacterized protein n=1 Tax=Streptomyces lasiicapitis TaxID=1923961 RepID=A0ABQ2MWE2_9ACTN|nr:hypothetical protein [Streptomyces lasiicapitis]GGO59014.1 hypothetical protein GCM10012286_79640 [Streptomyces lasiicapitis]